MNEPCRNTNIFKQIDFFLKKKGGGWGETWSLLTGTMYQTLDSCLILSFSNNKAEVQRRLSEETNTNIKKNWKKIQKNESH